MPHIDIKCHTREISDEQKQALASDICDVIKKHFGSKDETLSVSLLMFEPDRWKTEVYDPQIKDEAQYLIKKPGYEL